MKLLFVVGCKTSESFFNGASVSLVTNPILGYKRDVCSIRVQTANFK